MANLALTEKLNKTITKRMLHLRALAISRGRVESSIDWLNTIGINHKQALTQIKDGRASFQPVHILLACEIVGVSTDYVYGRVSLPVPPPVVKKAVTA